MAAGLDHNVMTGPSHGSRQAAIRAAFEATRQLKGHPDREVRDALHAELAARGIADIAPASLDPLVDAVIGGPRRAVLIGMWSTLVEARDLFRGMPVDSLPSWLDPPRRARELEWVNTRSAVHAIVELAPDDPTIVDRIFDDVPAILGDPDGDGASGRRIFPCWVDSGPLDDINGTVSVHVGKYKLGRLQPADSVVVRQILAADTYTAVQLNAVAVDGSPRFIELGVPDTA